MPEDSPTLFVDDNYLIEIVVRLPYCHLHSILDDFLNIRVLSSHF